jgi:hypothetical protein
MTVATFLAGFVFTALSAVLLLSPNDWSWHRVVAAIALTGSLCLLVSSVYMFDQLGTPVGFWTDNRPPAFWRWLAARRERTAEKRWEQQFREKGAAEADEENAPWRLDGPVYRYMLQITRQVFNPAVFLGLIGFLALIVGTASAWVMVGGSLVLVTAIVYAVGKRPNLGAD